MGNTHSHQHRKESKYHKNKVDDGNKLSTSLSTPLLPTDSNGLATAPTVTPTMSTKSSPLLKSDSRPNSVMGDVIKASMHKIMLGRSSSTIDVTSTIDSADSVICNTKVPPRRSFSAPVDQSSNNDGTMYTKVDGRLFQTLNNKYCLPIDEEEQDRLTNTHYVLKHCFGDNFSAPVHDLLSRSVSVARDANTAPFTSLSQQCMMDNNKSKVPPSPTAVSSAASSVQTGWPNVETPARVLDVACGSGVWVLELASQFPEAEFYGIDFACIYPNTIKPRNTNFSQCDITDPEGLPYPDEHFDYVHMRLVYNCFSSSDLKFVLSEIKRVLKPGGYIEFRDMDPTIKNPGPETDKLFSDFIGRMSELHSVDMTWTQHMSEVLCHQGGFTDIHHQEVSIGFGYEGPLATSIDCSIRDALKSYKQFFMEAYNISSEVCDEKTNLVIEECSKHRSFFNYYMAWGRKPLVSEQLINNIPSGQESPLVPLTPVPTSLSNSLEIANNPIPSTVPDKCQKAFLEATLNENAFDIVHFANGFTE